MYNNINRYRTYTYDNYSTIGNMNTFPRVVRAWASDLVRSLLLILIFKNIQNLM